MVPYTISNLLIISETRACRPKYQTTSAVTLCKDHTIPSLNVTSVWLCITLLPQKPTVQMRLLPFGWNSTKGIKFQHLPTTCEVTLGQEFSHCGTDSISVHLHLLPEHFLLFLPVIAPLPTSSVLVMQHHIQCAYYDPTIFQ